MIGFQTLFVVFRLVLFVAVSLFVLWFALNGIIWIFRITFDRFGIDFTDHWTWLKSKLPEIKWKKKVSTPKIVETISEETKGNEDEKPTV